MRAANIFCRRKMPVRILQPTGENRFIALVERMLIIKQADHDPCSDAEATNFTYITRIDIFLESRLVDYIYQDV
jgi:hypothetical protein